MEVIAKLAKISVARTMLGGISKPKIYGLVREKRLTLVHLDGMSFITMDSIVALVAAMKAEAESTPLLPAPKSPGRPRGPRPIEAESATPPALPRRPVRPRKRRLVPPAACAEAGA